MIPWNQIFSKSVPDAASITDGALTLRNLSQLKRFLDATHVSQCLVKPYQELGDRYPCVEARELLPSFESDMFEYPELSGFSMVAFGRPLESFAEVFQFDRLHQILHDDPAACCPLENEVMRQNLRVMSMRLPRPLQAEFLHRFHNHDVTLLEHYPNLMPYLLEMDRAQVMSLDRDGLFHLAGIFASFPSDIDSELKRFGMRIGKFVYGDNEMYERNRMFVYQFLMELYGFPIVSERRTSSALFARKLHKMGESFLLRVMGQSDRTITTYLSDGGNRRYPRVEKIALVRVERDQAEASEIIRDRGFFLDPEKRVVIMRIRYRQHLFNPANVRQDRALSVSAQDILHPLTGEVLSGLNIIKDTSNMFLRLNDIVRGEYMGRIVYKRNEVVENTDTDEKRLKFLYSWLTKHQRRMISYGDEFFDKVRKVISSYLQSPEKSEIFDSHRELYQEARAKLSYIQQARRVRLLEDLSRRRYRGSKIGYRQMCAEAVSLLNELQFEIVNFFPDLVENTIRCVDRMLHDSYLRRTYINVPENGLSRTGLEIRKNYGRMVALLDAFRAVRKARLSSENKKSAEVA